MSKNHPPLADKLMAADQYRRRAWSTGVVEHYRPPPQVQRAARFRFAA